MDINDVKHLATLARLDISEEEQQALLLDLKSILNYIDQVRNAPTSGGETSVPAHHNSAREDAVTNTADMTDKLLAQAVDTQDNFVKVKKILG